MKLPTRWLILTLFLLSPAVAMADDTPAASETATEPSRHRGSLSLELPFVTQYLSADPHGFLRKQYAPPFSIAGEYFFPIKRDAEIRNGFWGRANLSFSRIQGVPFPGLTAGWKMETSSLTVEGGLEGQFQTIEDVAPLDGSQYDADWLALVGRARYRLGNFIPAFRFDIIQMTASKMGNYEGIETRVEHHVTGLIGPSIEYRSDLGLLASAALDVYFLGATAIASKDFAFAVPGNTVLRSTLGLGLATGELELWSRLAFVTKVNDVAEHYLIAPFLYDHYLSAAQILTIEAKWHL